MHFSILLLVVIGISGAFAYSLWLSSARAVQSIRVDEELAQLTAQIETLNASSFSLPDHAEMHAKFELSCRIVRAFIKNGDLDSAEALIKKTQDLLNRYELIRQRKRNT